MTVQWYAFDFPFGTFLPKALEDGTLIWNNTAAAFYQPVVDPDRWRKGQRLIGTIQGAVFNEYARWVPQYTAARPGYQAFEVWDKPTLTDDTVLWVRSNICDSFVQASLCAMYGFGQASGGTAFGTAAAGSPTIRRNYIPLISKSAPEAVDMDDPAQMERVRAFYSSLRKVVSDGRVRTTEFVKMLADDLDMFYVYDSTTATYLRVKLSPPYLPLDSLYQPMRLPWLETLAQDPLTPTATPTAPPVDKDDVVDEGLLTSDLSVAASATTRLFARRAPPVLAAKLKPVLKPDLLAALIFAAAAAAGLNQMGWAVTDELELGTGTCVGLAIGLVIGRAL
uniref:Uncharacterized protein n=1 Tax=Calcidiscus leptoporus TaxID=127549 RepID=A0A7S0JBA4_9EUKA|mmetsp:Transcript_48373/g.112029  ORF Transcript_48373/g.112029 Transcript_48373/m.112029 type:complete len:337 (+) Transcript_48373:253-1263(+)